MSRLFRGHVAIPPLAGFRNMSPPTRCLFQRSARWLARAFALAAGLAGMLGCSAQEYKAKADKEVYDIVGQKMKQVTGEAKPFTIEAKDKDPLEGMGRPATAEEQKLLVETLAYGPAASKVRMLSLRECLEVAARNSREYQNERENVYSQALALTLERVRWTPQFGWTLTSDYTVDGGRGEAKTETISGGSAFSVSQILATGGTVTASLSSSLFRTLVSSSGDPSTASSLVFKVVQPLWRGSGAVVARESITQAERTMVYAIRDFVRYQKSFTVSVATSFYRLLQQKDVVANAERNYRSLVDSSRSTAMMAEAGRRAEFEAMEARQRVLSAQNSWISAQETYKTQADSFRVLLGLPTDAAVLPDPGELEAVKSEGLTPPGLTLDAAVAYALEHRLDRLTSWDRVADAERKALVAKDGLGAQLDMTGSVGISGERDSHFDKFSFDQRSYRLGLELDLPLERTAERNAYVQALITLERSKRSLQQSEDNIKKAVRASWRTLSEAAESYRIQKESVRLAQQRADGTRILLDAGRATMRTYLDAQQDLLNAQNALTQALINHKVARLEFYRDIEMLTVDENGMWRWEPGAAKPDKEEAAHEQPQRASAGSGA